MNIPDPNKLALIKSECDGKTRDNYTCWLIPIDKVEKDSADENPGETEEAIVAEAEEAEATERGLFDFFRVIKRRLDNFRKRFSTRITGSMDQKRHKKDIYSKKNYYFLV